MMLPLPAPTTQESALTTPETALGTCSCYPYGGETPRGSGSSTAEAGATEAEAGARSASKPQPNAPDWLTAQAKAIATARPKKPRSAYQRRWR